MPKRKLEDLLNTREMRKTSTKPIDKSIGNKSAKTNSATKGESSVNPPKERSKRTRRSAGPVNVSRELSSLKFSSTQNKDLPSLPSNTTISKRPINHGPIASRFAGATVPKVVYVSRKTPVISAVKRVKQFLREVEKRTMQSLGVDGILNRAGNSKHGDNELQIKLGQVSDKLQRDKEEVLVKASGRAIEQALRIAEWFRNREDEMLCQVEVRTGSVSVIDDIVELEPAEDIGDVEGDDEEEVEKNEDTQRRENSTLLEMGDTTLELLKNLENGEHPGAAQEADQMSSTVQEQAATFASKTKRKRRKHKKKEYDQDDLPEARLRWVKTVEVAVSLRA